VDDHFGLQLSPLDVTGLEAASDMASVDDSILNGLSADDDLLAQLVDCLPALKASNVQSESSGPPQPASQPFKCGTWSLGEAFGDVEKVRAGLDSLVRSLSSSCEIDRVDIGAIHVGILRMSFADN